ncbi:hypothetical protein, partial [Aeromonas veronii]|uniref:hypothetical protein n=1 Tax=Aeromonas veronii TaxID=654 RepID=UPI0038B5B980
ITICGMVSLSWLLIADWLVCCIVLCVIRGFLFFWFSRGSPAHRVEETRLKGTMGGDLMVCEFHDAMERWGWRG